MAIVNLNPILKELHGRIGNIVFYRRRDRDYVRVYVKGRNPDTAGQRIVRRTFGDAVKSWQVMTPEERIRFNRKAANLNMSGYNLYISQYMKTRITAFSKPDSKNNTPDKLYLSAIQRPVSSVSPPFINSIIESMTRKTVRYEPG